MITQYFTAVKINMFILGGLLLFSGPVFAAWWPDHVNQAANYIAQIKANNNNYGGPAALYLNVSGELQALTKCSSFATLLLKNTYPSIVTDAAVIALTGSSSPYADEWYSAILMQKSDADSGISLHKRATVTEIQRGDILASAYNTSGNTGHVMIVGAITLASANITPPYLIPGVPKVNKYIVKIYDSTNSIHGNYASSTQPDSRYKKQWDGKSWVADTGIGSGYIVIYEDLATGSLVAWAWNTSTKTTSFYYAVTPPQGSALEFRPIEAGFMFI